MAVDPLGLVYSGGDGTGAAFKAPWTSYDPYQAEVARGANMASIVEQKKKLDDKAQADMLKLATVGKIGLQKYADGAYNLTQNQTEYLAGLYADNNAQKAKVEAPMIGQYNKGYSTVAESVRKSYDMTRAKLTNTPAAYREEAERNLAILLNPGLASPDEFPDIYAARQANLEKANLMFQGTPWMTPELIENHADLMTAQQFLPKLTEIPKNYPEQDWYPKVLASAKYELEKDAEAEGRLTTRTEKLTEDKAKAILSTAFDNDIQLQSQMTRNYRAERERNPGKYTDVKDYFMKTYTDRLVKEDIFESLKQGIVFSMGNTITTTAPNGEERYSTPVGSEINQSGSPTGNPLTTVTPHHAKTSLNLSGSKGTYGQTSVNTYYPYSQVDELGVMKPNKNTISGVIDLNNVVNNPVAKKDIRIPGTDKVIPKGAILTDKTMDIIRNKGYRLSPGDIGWGTFIETVITSENGVETAYTPLSVHEDSIRNQFLGDKKTFNKPGIPADDVFEYYGLPKGTSQPSGGGTTTTTIMTGGNVR